MKPAFHPYALIPLAIVSLLAGLTFWLAKISEYSPSPSDAKQRHDPDYWLENSLSREFNEKGILISILSAPRLEHYPDDDSAIIRKPQAQYVSPQRSPIIMQAQQATLHERGERVEMSGKVTFQQKIHEKGYETTLLTNQLTLFPSQQIATTRSPVSVISGPSRLHGQGLDYNHQTRLLRISGRVTGSFERKTK